MVRKKKSGWNVNKIIITIVIILVVLFVFAFAYQSSKEVSEDEEGLGQVKSGAKDEKAGQEDEENLDPMICCYYSCEYNIKVDGKRRKRRETGVLEVPLSKCDKDYIKENENDPNVQGPPSIPDFPKNCEFHTIEKKGDSCELNLEKQCKDSNSWTVTVTSKSNGEEFRYPKGQCDGNDLKAGSPPRIKALKALANAKKECIKIAKDKIKSKLKCKDCCTETYNQLFGAHSISTTQNLGGSIAGCHNLFGGTNMCCIKYTCTILGYCKDNNCPNGDQASNGEGPEAPM